MDIQNIFPTPIGISKLNRPLNQQELDLVLSLEKVNNHSNYTSRNNYVLNDPALADLKEWCEKELNKYYNIIYLPKYESNIYITQSWINITNKGQSHHEHSHGNSFLSAVFYIKSNRESGKINFHKRNEREFHIDSSEFNEYNCDTWKIGLEDLEMIIFPSNLRHSVDVFNAEQQRISLAMNSFIKGVIGSPEQLTALDL